MTIIIIICSIVYYVVGWVIYQRRMEIGYELVRQHPIAIIPMLIINIVWPIWVLADWWKGKE